MPRAGILVSLWWALFRNIVVSCHSVLNKLDTSTGSTEFRDPWSGCLTIIFGLVKIWY